MMLNQFFTEVMIRRVTERAPALPIPSALVADSDADRTVPENSVRDWSSVVFPDNRPRGSCADAAH